MVNGGESENAGKGAKIMWAPGTNLPLFSLTL
jgi:hypothetical protein